MFCTLHQLFRFHMQDDGSNFAKNNTVSSGGSRIFPRGGREPSRGGVNTPNFPENCMKSKEFGRPGGGRASLTPPLDPPMVSHPKKVGKQECIPVGCVPSATVAVSVVGGGLLRGGGCLLWGDACSGGCLLLEGGCLLPGGGSAGGTGVKT